MPKFVFHAAWSISTAEGWSLVLTPMVQITKSARACRITFMWLGALVVFSIHTGGQMTKGIIHTPVESKAGRRMVRAKGARTAAAQPTLTHEQLEWNARMQFKKKNGNGSGGDNGRHA